MKSEWRRSQEEMYVIRYYGPGKAVGFRIGENSAKAFKELDAVGIIFKDLLPFDTPDNDMMKCIRSINSRLGWHMSFLSPRRSPKLTL